MRLSLKGLEALVALALPGCIADRGFPCSTSEMCVLDGVPGRCESTGWCSYPDVECGGMHRYELLAGDGVAGICVDELCGVTSLIGGAEHNCVVDGLGRVWCWAPTSSANSGLASNRRRSTRHAWLRCCSGLARVPMATSCLSQPPIMPVGWAKETLCCVGD
ncbi:MAG: hypothetical protein JKY37_24215 [Nannocystaceae bacterium]|nr:hypothetical protein [Nannocystaceae bacterium]